MPSIDTNQIKLVRLLESLLESVKNDKLSPNEIDDLLVLLTRDANLEKEIVRSLFLGNFVLQTINNNNSIVCQEE